MYGRKLIQHNKVEDNIDEYDKLLLNDLLGLPYMPEQKGTIGMADRNENPIVFFEVSAGGGQRLRSGEITQPQVLGRMYVELRKDIVPVACGNFLALCTGLRGRGEDGVNYHFKGIRIHRIVKDLMFQSGDLLDAKGECSRSIYNHGGLFRDESFVLRHTALTSSALALFDTAPLDWSVTPPKRRFGVESAAQAEFDCSTPACLAKLFVLNFRDGSFCAEA
eukprot:gene10897-12715_t